MRYPTLAAPSFLRPVAIFAGVTSSVQATVNIVLSILGILVYECKILISDSNSLLEKCFAATYFQGSSCSSAVTHVSIDGMLTPDTVFAWVCAYLAVDAVWLIISVTSICLCVQFDKKTVLPCLYVWTLFTLGVCCMDLAATIYFALQSQALTIAQIEEISGKNVSGTFHLLAQECGGTETLLSVPIIIMAMTARYFIFWLLNAALVTVIGVSALGISSRNSRDQDFFDDNISSQVFFNGGGSVNSVNNDSRRDVSVIDGWKEPWQRIPVVRIPKARSVKSAASLYSVPEAHFSEASLATTEFRGQHETDDEDRFSRTSSMPSVSPIPPPPPPMPPPSPPRAAGRRTLVPKKHPPPPPDQKPLKPALKSRY
ncbi:uncharacterized protein LOC124158794 isoform X2 [Ischnura elegans]|uniref:uncharacterized protein LOC124158794 isoform X2 n=1 Tax=Ischnura elegans TaxID=197161 RepID=UPI001ED8836B|nr:uncharacterized protein LOC124158794 isoform X2 [Ischnura elegans]